VDGRVQYMQDLAHDGDLRLAEVGTAAQRAEILTKPLTCGEFFAACGQVRHIAA
jgi:hypothetical protein